MRELLQTLSIRQPLGNTPKEFRPYDIHTAGTGDKVEEDIRQEGEDMNDISKTIGWAEKSFNPITGCLGGCSYCYARKIAMRFNGHFNSTFHEGRLGEPLKLKKPSRIFADSMSDFWGRGVKQSWRNKVYATMKATPQHTYFLLTKQPQRIKDAKKIPENVWVGVSITNFDDRWRMARLVASGAKKKFVSLDPLLDDNVSDYVYLADWIIVGCLTGQKNAFRPKKKTIQEIIDGCRKLEKPLFIKDNVGWKNEIKELNPA
jgi:protein gp37